MDGQYYEKKLSNNKSAFIIEIILIICIAIISGYINYSNLKANAARFTEDVKYDYNRLYHGYITNFYTMRMQAVEKIEEDISFEEMNQWLQSKNTIFEEAVGKDTYDGFAFTYKGGYARSWDYGDYTNYDATTRPWHIEAEKANGKAVVVAPYVTYLNPVYLNNDEYILLTIAQKYNDDIYFDYDLKITEIKKLLNDRAFQYDDSEALLYNSEGYILSSTDDSMFAHNINTQDEVISTDFSNTIVKSENKDEILCFANINGKIKLVYSAEDSYGNQICLMYNFWTIFVKNFLPLIIVACILLLFIFIFYRKNKIHIAEFRRRDVRLSHINNIAFDKNMYIDVETMKFSGEEELIQLCQSNAYETLFPNMRSLLQTSDENTLREYDAFLSPDALKSEAKKAQETVCTKRFAFKSELINNNELTVYDIHRMLYFIDNRKVICILATDVTDDVKLLKQALLDAKNANHSKTEFFSRMSHDMRTPMNGILGLSELSSEENNVAILKENIKKIKQSGTYLLGLINDTLDFQKIESGRLELDLQTVVREEIIDDVLNIIRPMAQDKNINLRVINESLDMNVCVKTDAMRMKQIILNLLSNAVKFTPKDGVVIFKIENLGQHGLTSRERITIADSGIGMGQDFLQNQIFTPFAQENSSIAVNYNGTGLGLSIVKKLVEMMNGTIEVTSEVGVGSTFILTFDFEMIDSNQEKNQRQKKEKQNCQIMELLKEKRILLIEDHPLNAKIAKKLLEKAGCIIEWEINGQAGVQRFQEEPEGTFDIILMDIRMPVMDGIEATKVIRACDKTDARTIPIIAMTANAYESDKQESIMAGMNAHISKPINPQELYQIIAQSISKL